MWSGGLATLNPRDANIVITGFMGSGKSTVGRRVAERLRRDFVDTDTEIVRRAGMSIPQIFETQGEAAFRAMEKALVSELAEKRRLVIATGGGMLVDPENREMLARSGLLVCLDADPADIERRLSHSRERPLAANWRELYEQRRSAYAAIPFHVNSAGLSVNQTAERIIALWKTSLR
ncbi:shikimate kinase [Anaerolineae bacterium CFX9]|jgi:shikimate kinase|nr:shikimate kinase [Anaerolineae bacterium CFX9]